MWRQCCLESAHRTAQETISVKECIAPKNPKEPEPCIADDTAHVGRSASASCGCKPCPHSAGFCVPDVPVNLLDAPCLAAPFLLVNSRWQYYLVAHPALCSSASPWSHAAALSDTQHLWRAAVQSAHASDVRRKYLSSSAVI